MCIVGGGAGSAGSAGAAAGEQGEGGALQPESHQVHDGHAAAPQLHGLPPPPPPPPSPPPPPYALLHCITQMGS